MREDVISTLHGSCDDTLIDRPRHFQSSEGVLQKGFSPRLEEDLTRKPGAAHASLHDCSYGWDWRGQEFKGGEW